MTPIRIACPDCGGDLYEDVHSIDGEHWFECYMCADCGWWVPMLSNRFDKVPQRMENGKFGVYAEDIELA